MLQPLQQHQKLKTQLELLQSAVLKPKEAQLKEYNLYKVRNSLIVDHILDLMVINLLGKKTSELGCNSVCQTIVSHRLATVKINKGIL